MIKSARCHFFTIWPNGFTYIDDILHILRTEPAIEILRIEKRNVKNMHRFVFDLYACDTVPISHLQSKLKYLFNLPPEIINIFVSNHNPQEVVSGTPPFRKKQCQTMVRIKQTIRNQYNPRHPDPNFHIPPLDRGITHEHVIHASDREEQTDYILKLLGHPEGLNFLINDDIGLPFEKPLHIPRPQTYSFRKLPVDKLRASILVTNKKKILTPIQQTPHYQGLTQDSRIYLDYLNKFRFTIFKDNHSWTTLQKLNELDDDNLAQVTPILVTPIENGMYRILDGVHRAAAQVHHGYRKINCVVFET